MTNLPPPPSSEATPQPLCTVGDIAVTRTTVITPNGQSPLAGTTWIVTNQTTVSQATPSWAIVLAVIFAFACLLGLLFLLAKEQRVSGFVQVTVQRDGFYHATQIPVSHAGHVADVEARVNYIRSLAAQAS